MNKNLLYKLIKQSIQKIKYNIDILMHKVYTVNMEKYLLNIN